MVANGISATQFAAMRRSHANLSAFSIPLIVPERFLHFQLSQDRRLLQGRFRLSHF